MRKWIIVMLVFLGCIVHAQENHLLSLSYEPSFHKGAVGDYLKDVEQRTNVALSYSGSSVDEAQIVQLPERSYNVQDALNIILNNQKVLIVERKNKILIVPASQARRYTRSSTYTINGYIKEEGSKEVLIGANIYIPASQTGAMTNNSGFFSFSLPEGNYKLVCSYIGYRADTLDVKLSEDKRLDVQLKPLTRLEEVRVTSEKNISPGHSHLTLDDIESKPMLLGEPDVMRALQNEAGVQSGTEGSNNIYVRGGEPGQNLHLLDGVPLYYTNHFGLLSIFNADAIKSVDFHKGAFPARYGGRLSSIIEVNTKDGDMEHWHGQFSMGLVKASLSVEGPIIKDKASIMVSGRRSWIDGLWRPFTNDVKADFHDLNIKANYILNKNNRLYLSFYTGRDQLGFSIDNTTSYNNRSGNKFLSAKWNVIANPKLFINTLVTASEYLYNNKGDYNLIQSDSLMQAYFYQIKSSIRELAASTRINWYMNPYHHFETGIRLARTSFLPSIAESATPLTAVETNFAGEFRATEVTLFAEDEIKLGEKWMLRPGIHWSNWFNSDFNYSSLQPRFYLRFTPWHNHTFHASFTQMAQFLHSISGGFATSLLSNNSNFVNWNTESYAPSTDRIAPEEAIMGTLGYTGKPAPQIEYGIDFYYKDIANIPALDTRKYVFDNSLPWEDRLIVGKGWSYGMEVFLKQHIGHVRLQAAYTLAWNWREYKELNEGAPFPYRFDRRHNIRLAAVYRPNNRFDMSANWSFMTGEAITLPDQLYPDFDNNLSIDMSSGSFWAYTPYNYSYSTVNSYRLPPIHRLDLGFNFHKKVLRKCERTWGIGMFNIYGRTNIMSVNLVNTSNGIAIRGTGFLKFIPFVNYKLTF